MPEDPFETSPLLVGTKRGSIQVSAELLKAAENGANQSHLFRLANVNHARGKVYLESLERAELLAERAGTYKLTSKGRRFLDHWEHIEAYLRSDGEEADAAEAADAAEPGPEAGDGGPADGSGDAGAGPGAPARSADNGGG